MVAEAYGREGDLLEAARLLEKASRIGQLTLRQLYNLARSRHLTGDLDGALQALRSFFDGSAKPNGETPRALVLAALNLLQLLGGEDVGVMVADSPVIAGCSMLDACGGRGSAGAVGDHSAKARTTASGSRSMTVSKTRAARSGTRRPCSHSCTARTSEAEPVRESLAAELHALAPQRDHRRFCRGATFLLAHGRALRQGPLPPRVPDPFVRLSSVPFLLLDHGDEPRKQLRVSWAEVFPIRFRVRRQQIDRVRSRVAKIRTEECAAVPHLGQVGVCRKASSMESPGWWGLQGGGGGVGEGMVGWAGYRSCRVRQPPLGTGQAKPSKPY